MRSFSSKGHHQSVKTYMGLDRRIYIQYRERQLSQQTRQHALSGASVITTGSSTCSVRSVSYHNRLVYMQCQERQLSQQTRLHTVSGSSVITTDSSTYSVRIVSRLLVINIFLIYIYIYIFKISITK